MQAGIIDRVGGCEDPPEVESQPREHCSWDGWCETQLQYGPIVCVHYEFVQSLGHNPAALIPFPEEHMWAKGCHLSDADLHTLSWVCLKAQSWWSGAQVPIGVREWKHAEGIVRKHGRDQNLTTTFNTINNKRSERWEGRKGRGDIACVYPSWVTSKILKYWVTNWRKPGLPRIYWNPSSALCLQVGKARW